MFIKSAIAAFVGAALVASTAMAGTPSTLVFNTGDLLLGFRSQSGTITNEYLLDIGSARSFVSGSPLSFDLSLGNVGTDLSATFGANWYANSDIAWGIVGSSSLGNVAIDGRNTIYSSNASLYPDVTTNAPLRDDGSTQNQDDTYITGVSDVYRGKTSTANSAVGLVQSASLFNSWSSQASISFGNSGDLGVIENTFGQGSASALDLFRSTIDATNSNQGAYVGTFSVSNTGVVSFTNNIPAVPEPSTYALLAIGAGLVAFAARRNRQSANA